MRPTDEEFSWHFDHHPLNEHGRSLVEALEAQKAMIAKIDQAHATHHEIEQDYFHLTDSHYRYDFV